VRGPAVLLGAVLAAAAAGLTAGAGAEAAPPAPLVEGHLLTRRWVYVQNNFQAQGNVQRVNAILDRAAAAGFNGAVFSDGKFGRLDDGSLIPAYYTNLRAVLDHARDLGLAAIPATANFGYSNDILWHDPNLAEGLPVRGATFRAGGGRLVPYEARPVRLANGDFEALPASGDQFPGWAFQDAPGTATFVDRDVRHGGRASLRMTDLGTTNPGAGNGRVYQRLAVDPFKAYHASVWVRTRGFRGGEVRLLVLAQNPARTLQWNPVPVKADQDWTRFDVTFNTLTHGEVLVYLGVWGGDRGTIWWDDAALEPAGAVNVVRRPGAPVSLTSEDGATRYAEGTDIEAFADPRMGMAAGYNGTYDAWHEPPEIRIPAGSRIRDGDVVRADYYHTTTIYGDQVAASLTEPAVLGIVAGQLASTRREFAVAGAFGGWMLSHDEIRVHGWDEAPKAGAGSPGENLAFNFRTLYDAARALDPQGEVLTWSDMFDPTHNAADSADPYYLVNGGWSGSWEGVPADVVILNWNHGARRRESAAFFAGRGHRQVLAGYYDASPGGFSDRGWLRDLAGVPGIEGVMYTQWDSGYANLEAWAQHVWGDAPLVTPTAGAIGSPSSSPPIPTPAATVTAVATMTPDGSGERQIYVPIASPGERTP